MGYTEITTEDELREAIGGYATGRAATKVRPQLHPLQIEWLKASPFCVIATSDAAGNCDASPKGDPAGHLIHVLDPRTVVIAERPGNKRADGYLNVLANPHVGVISLIPGRNDTLRINGRARLVRDAPFFDDLAVRGQRPVLAMVIEIDQVFSHCPKAFMRSRLWRPSTWRPDAVPTTAALCKAVQDPPETLEELEAHYSPGHYSTLLY
ncbi:MAG TPA: MSMEG_1061 family FMN-dependent PPOX-type flavoprotein [Streptosporangiaceae bacterium]|nr:MSMEG_1061 family FMN-dependent PPOX-type flavoprotein [Streptosporangiaceae bacterium]